MSRYEQRVVLKPSPAQPGKDTSYPEACLQGQPDLIPDKAGKSQVNLTLNSSPEYAIGFVGRAWFM